MIGVRLGVALWFPADDADIVSLMQVDKVMPTGEIVGRPVNTDRLVLDITKNKVYQRYNLRHTGFYIVMREHTPVVWYCVSWEPTRVRCVEVAEYEVDNVKQLLSVNGDRAADVVHFLETLSND